MNLSDVCRALATAERQGLAEARMTLDRLRPVAREPWIDHRARAALLELARRCREPLEIPSAAPLRAGEAWLLLALGEDRGRVVRMTALPSRTATATLPRTETFAALRGLAAAAVQAKRFVPSDLLETRFALADGETPVSVEGSSLGLSACVALVSHLARRAPAMNVACTAAVCAQSGRLLPVAALATKLQAVREEWPEVDTVIVSAEQKAIPEVKGLKVVHCDDLADALPAFGLSMAELPSPSVDELRERVRGLARLDGQSRALAQWSALSQEARELADLLQMDDPSEAAHAQVWSALFASHAGDNQTAARVLELVTAEAMELPVHKVMRDVVCASVQIDDSPAAAESLARLACENATSLVGADRRAWLGKALGTHGRAILHGGDPARAEPLLRGAHEHHLTHVRWEAPRSACYRACCLRLLGHADQALALVSSAAELARELEPRYEAMATTLSFLTLELGRALAELGRHDEAIAALESLIEPGVPPAKYPRLGAHRTLASLSRKAGRVGEGHDHLLACWAVALDGSHGMTARKVGAVAAAEELLEARREGRAPALAPKEVEAVWAECFGSAPMERVVRFWIY